tara:strand:+ start:301 stop:693 length:393 start_codon:yes stop_codon:yes gene_type:complete
MESKPLIPLGTNITVDKTRIQNILPSKLIDNLPRRIEGEVVDYKMTDGMGIGYVLLTNENIKIWIFNNELDEETKKTYQTVDTSYGEYNNVNLLENHTINYEINGTRNIRSLISPINLIKWILYTSKDIF